MARNNGLAIILFVVALAPAAWAADTDTSAVQLVAPRIAGIEPLTEHIALIWWDSVDVNVDDVQLNINGKPWSNSAQESTPDARQGWLIVGNLLPRHDYRLALRATGEQNTSMLGSEFSYTHHEPLLDWTWLPGGKFVIGSQSGDETPPHFVELSGYLLSAAEITNRQYLTFCDSTALPYPSEPHFPELRDYVYRRPNYPVVNVSWHDAVLFCQWLSWQANLPLAFDSSARLVDPTGVRLPTEAEWEHAACTPQGIYPWGNALPDKSLANFAETERQAPTAVRSFAPTADGLFDLAGNVWEWCLDWYGAYQYESTPILNPVGADSGTFKVVRGGSWGDPAVALKSTYRGKLSPEQRLSTVGFRVARTLPIQPVRMINSNLTEGDHAVTK